MKRKLKSSPNMLILARAATTDWYDLKQDMKRRDEPARCKLCNDSYSIEPGDDPTPICDSCAHEVAAILGREILRLAGKNRR